MRQAEFPTDLKRRENMLPVNSGKIITIPGVRRCGKTSRMENVVNSLLSSGIERERILWVSFDDERLVRMKAEDLDQIIEAYRELYPDIEMSSVYMFFDEIQLIEGWEFFIMRLYKHYSKNIYISGSNATMLGSELKSALRGWPLEEETLPLSFREYCDFKGVMTDSFLEADLAKVRNAFFDYNRDGGFPEVVLTIHGDIKSRGLKVSKDNLYDWANHACNIFMFFRIANYSKSLQKVESSQPKYYCIDNGMRNAVLLPQSDDDGKKLENTVFLQLYRHRTPADQIFYYQGKGECDFVVQRGSEIDRLIQVTWDMSDMNTRQREINGIIEAAEVTGCKNLSIITADTSDEIRLSNGLTIRVIPAWQWLAGI